MIKKLSIKISRFIFTGANLFAQDYDDQVKDESGFEIAIVII